MTGLWYVGLLSTDGPTGTLHVFDRSHVAGLVSADIDRGAGTYGGIYLGLHFFSQAPHSLYGTKP